MGITIGQQLGSYEISLSARPVWVEVYRGRDTKVKREVAIVVVTILVMELGLEPISRLGAAISPRDCAVSVHVPLDVHSPFREAPEPPRQRH
jgi:hypothetical protein